MMIHSKSIVDKAATLDEKVDIGAYAIIEGGVHLAKGVKVLPFAHIKGNTYIGENTFIGTGAVIGEVPQIMGFQDAAGKVYIGKNNIIREYVTIHSSMSADKVTSLGNNNFLMAFSHIGHDCKISNNVVICNGALIGGHVEIGEKAFISANVGVHQFVRIGRLSIVGALSRANQDVLPFMMVLGNSKVWGLNIVGLKRASFSKEEISSIRKAYKIIYRKELSKKNIMPELEKIESDRVKEMIIFMLSSKRGICGPKKSTFWEKLFLDYPYFLRTEIPTRHLFSKIDREKLR